MKKKKFHNYKIGEIVVYPKHGVGEIKSILRSLDGADFKATFTS